MKKLTNLILSAAIVPAFALSTAAIASEHDDMQKDSEQPTGVQHTDDKNDRQQQSGMQGSSELATGEQRSSMQDSDRQRLGEQQLSSKPAGAFHADDVIGSTVKHRRSDEDVGDIEDLIIGEDGQIIGVVIKTSGFLGLGGQDTGLGWDHIEHTIEDDESVFYTDIDEETLRDSPKYERD